MQRMARAGFKRDFVRSAILPDWWEERCEEDVALLADIELRVARFLAAPVASVRNADDTLVVPPYPGAQLRRVVDLDRDRLAPAIHAAIQIASAVVRSLREPSRPVNVPPVDALAWRAQISPGGSAVKLESVLADCWERGIPVVSIESLPAPSFQGLACVVGGRPVIVLGHKHDEPGRIAFLLAHEVGHLVAGDCNREHPVVDEQDEIVDDSDLESRADAYATGILAGSAGIPTVSAEKWKELASKAAAIERDTGVDAGAMIWAWARKSGNFSSAVLAVKALYRATGARKLLRRHLEQHIDFESAAESDRTLIRCVFGEPEHDAAAV